MTGVGEFGKGKTIFVLAIVIGCFAVLWPKIFYPMLTASISQTGGDNGVCCDVISEKDTNAYKVMNEICTNIMRKEQMVQQQKKSPVKVSTATLCRNEVLQSCGVDITGLLKEDQRITSDYKKSLNQLRTFNTSHCMKLNYGVDFLDMGLPKSMKGPGMAHNAPRQVEGFRNHMRQERPFRPGPDMVHPALRERGRAIPTVNIPRRTIERENRPGPVPGMRPPVGGAGHIPSAPKGGGTMGIIMPMYTIGIVCFFIYTIMKILFKKSPEAEPVKPQPVVKDFGMDPEHRKYVLPEEYSEGSERSMKESFSKEDRDLGLRRRPSGSKASRFHEDRRKLDPPTVLFPTYPSDLQTDPDTATLTTTPSADTCFTETTSSDEILSSTDQISEETGTYDVTQVTESSEMTFELDSSVVALPSQSGTKDFDDISVPYPSLAEPGKEQSHEHMHVNKECVTEAGDTTAGTVTGFSVTELLPPKGVDSTIQSETMPSECPEQTENDVKSASCWDDSSQATERPVFSTDVSLCSSADTIMAESGPVSEADGESPVETVAISLPTDEKVEDEAPVEEALVEAVDSAKVQSAPPSQPRSEKSDPGPISPLAPDQTPEVQDRMHFFDQTIVIPDYEPEAAKRKQSSAGNEPAPLETEEEPQVTIVSQETVPQKVLDLADQVAEKILTAAKSELVFTSEPAAAPGESMTCFDDTAENDPASSKPVSQQPRLSLDTTLTTAPVNMLDSASAPDDDVLTDTTNTTTSSTPAPPAPTPEIHVETPHADQTEINKIAEFLETLNTEPKESEKLAATSAQSEVSDVAPIVTLADDTKDSSTSLDSLKPSQGLQGSQSKIEITPVEDKPGLPTLDSSALADICYVTQPLDETQKGRDRSKIFKSSVEIVSLDEGPTSEPTEKLRKTSEPANLMSKGLPFTPSTETLEELVKKLKPVTPKDFTESGEGSPGEKESKLRKERESSLAASQDSHKESEIDKYVGRMANMQETRKAMMERAMFASSQSSQGSEVEPPRESDQSSNFHGPGLLDSGQIEGDLPEEKIDKMKQVEEWASEITQPKLDSGIPGNEISSELEEPGTEIIELTMISPEILNKVGNIIDQAMRDGITAAVGMLAELENSDSPVYPEISREEVVQKLDQVLEELETTKFISSVPPMELNSEDILRLVEGAERGVELSSGDTNSCSSNKPTDFIDLIDNKECSQTKHADGGNTTAPTETCINTESKLQTDNTVTYPKIEEDVMEKVIQQPVTSLTIVNNVGIAENEGSCATHADSVDEAKVVETNVEKEPTPPPPSSETPVAVVVELTGEDLPVTTTEEKSGDGEGLEEKKQEEVGTQEEESQEPIIAELDSIQEEIDSLSTELNQMESRATAASAPQEEVVKATTITEEPMNVVEEDVEATREDNRSDKLEEKITEEQVAQVASQVQEDQKSTPEILTQVEDQAVLEEQVVKDSQPLEEISKTEQLLLEVSKQMEETLKTVEPAPEVPAQVVEESKELQITPTATEESPKPEEPAAEIPTQIEEPSKKDEPAAEIPTQIEEPSKKYEPAAEIPTQIEEPSKKEEPAAEIPTQIEEPSKQDEPAAEIPTQVEEPSKQDEPAAEILTQIEEPSKQDEPAAEIPTQVEEPSKQEEPVAELQTKQEPVAELPTQVQESPKQDEPVIEAPPQVQDPPKEEIAPEAPIEVQESPKQEEPALEIPVQAQEPPKQEEQRHADESIKLDEPEIQEPLFSVEEPKQEQAAEMPCVVGETTTREETPTISLQTEALPKPGDQVSSSSPDSPQQPEELTAVKAIVTSKTEEPPSEVPPQVEESSKHEEPSAQEASQVEVPKPDEPSTQDLTEVIQIALKDEESLLAPEPLTSMEQFLKPAQDTVEESFSVEHSYSSELTPVAASEQETTVILETQTEETMKTEKSSATVEEPPSKPDESLGTPVEPQLEFSPATEPSSLPEPDVISATQEPIASPQVTEQPEAIQILEATSDAPPPAPPTEEVQHMEICSKTDVKSDSIAGTQVSEQAVQESTAPPEEPQPKVIATFSFESIESPIAPPVQTEPVAILQFETLSEPPFPLSSSTQQEEHITDNQKITPDADTITVSCAIVDTQSSSPGAVMALTVEQLDENSPEIFPLPSMTTACMSITSPVEKLLQEDDQSQKSPSVIAIGVPLLLSPSDTAASADQQATEASSANADTTTTITIADASPDLGPSTDQLSSSGKILDDSEVPVSPPPPPTTPAVAQVERPVFPVSAFEEKIESQLITQTSAEPAPTTQDKAEVVVKVTEAQPQAQNDEKAKKGSGLRERDAIITAVKGIVEAFDASKPPLSSSSTSAPAPTEGRQAAASQSPRAQPVEEDLEELRTCTEGSKKEDLATPAASQKPATREKTPTKEVKFKLPPEEMELEDEEEEEEVELVRPPTPPKTLSKAKPKSPSPTPETVHAPTASSPHRDHDELLIASMQTAVSGSAADTETPRCTPTPPAADTTTNQSNITYSTRTLLPSRTPSPAQSLPKVANYKSQSAHITEQSAAAAIAAAKAAGSPSERVSVIGIEETASLFSGERWDNRTPTPTFRNPTPPVPHRPPSPPEQIPSIYLDGPMPSKGQEIMVRESQVEVEGGEDYELDDDYEPSAPVILSGKVTLSVISSAGGFLPHDELTEAPSLSLDDRAQAENSIGRSSTGSNRRNVAAEIRSANNEEVRGKTDGKKSSNASSPDMDEYEVIGKSGFGEIEDDDAADVSLDDYLTATDAEQDDKAQEDTAADISTMEDLMKPEQLPQDEE